MELLKKHILDDKILNCQKCEAPIKPDVILFGEKLSVDLLKEAGNLKEADLVFVMGTSLKVFPFNAIVSIIPKETPLVLINFENSLNSSFNKFLFLQGDIDTHVKRICEASEIDLSC